MEEKKLTELTDEELIQEAKKRKSAAIINAAFIGFLIGVIFYSIIKKSLGVLILIPTYLVYKLLTKPKHNKEELENFLKERNLK